MSLLGVRTWIVLLSLLAAPLSLRAQDSSTDAADEADRQFESFRRAIDHDPFTAADAGEQDPLAVGREDHALATMPLPTPDELAAPPVRAVEGQVLTAIPGVRERRHRTQVTFQSGLAWFSERSELISTARTPAEAHLEFWVPLGAGVVSFEVCSERGCRAGVPDRAEGPLSAYDDAVRSRTPSPSRAPIGQARIEGEKLIVEAAPVESQSPIEIRVTWAAAAERVGGQVEFRVPPNGRDARVSPREVELQTIDMVDPRLDGVPIEGVEVRESDRGFTLSASAPRTWGARAERVRVPCGNGRCARVRVVAGPVRMNDAPLLLALDASPSTGDGASGRIEPTARVVLSMLPPRTPVRIVVFAARSHVLAEGPAGEISVPAGAVDRELGSATRLEAIAEHIDGHFARNGARLLVLGDGGLTASTAGDAAARRLREMGLEVAWVDVRDDRDPTREENIRARIGAELLHCGEEADRAARDLGSEALRARLSHLLASPDARRVIVHTGSRSFELGTLRSGEVRVWEGEVTGRVSVSFDGRTLPIEVATTAVERALSSPLRRWIAVSPTDASAQVRACRMHPPYFSESGVGSNAGAIALARTRRCDPTSTEAQPRPERTRGLPARTLLASLRQRIIPVARACFRADRRGRPRISHRVEYAIVLADREVASSEVNGEVDSALASCLLAALDGLDIPRFDGTIRVRWPLHTEAVAPPPVIELGNDAAREVDSVLPDEPI